MQLSTYSLRKNRKSTNLFFMMVNRFVLIWLLFLPAFSVWGQQVVTEGRIVYTYSRPDMDSAAYERRKEQMVTTQTYCFRHGQFREEVGNTWGPKAKLVDLEAKRKVDLWQKDGNDNEVKVAVLSDEGFNADKEIKAQWKVEIEYLKGKQKISGFKCKKAKITFLDEEEDVEIIVWYTDQVKVPQFKYMFDMFYSFEGFPVQFEIYNPYLDFTNRLTLTEFESTDQPEELFQVPEDFQWREGMEFYSVYYR